MVKKIFALEDGSYSDYHVIGIYTTLERAEIVRQKVGGDISEWQLDPGWAEINAGLSRWIVHMLRDGTTERAWTAWMSGYDIDGGSVASVWDRPNAPAYRGKGIPACLMCNVWARNKKHAVKIANEKRVQMIASGEWEE